MYVWLCRPSPETDLLEVADFSAVDTDDLQHIALTIKVPSSLSLDFLMTGLDHSPALHVK